MPNDPRIVYGSRCLWWDSIDKVSILTTQSGTRLPCCPFCRGVLYEIPDLKTWEEGAKKYEANGHSGYVEVLNFMRGKCFKTMDEAKEALKLEKSKTKAKNN